MEKENRIERRRKSIRKGERSVAEVDVVGALRTNIKIEEKKEKEMDSIFSISLLLDFVLLINMSRCRQFSH